MKLSLSLNPGQKFFTAHGPDYVTVSGERYQQPVVVIPEQVFSDWPATCFASLEARHFEYFLALKPEVVLLGTGSEHRFAHPTLYSALSQAGIGVECMSTPAVCRTYNILMSEDRKVVAAILFE
ncbi:MAG TPA: Mth938-like domain-containing protein [Gallionellaceae bacterium]|nr:Mth938-like domain-containing protein [Gallionellaceae bacterium]